MKLTRETVEHVAGLAKIALSDREKEMLARQLGDVLGYMERLNEVDTTGAVPMLHVVDLENVTRPDDPRPALPGRGVFENAPESRAGLFLVPRVIDSEG